jgi:hypothetical protein
MYTRIGMKRGRRMEPNQELCIPGKTPAHPSTGSCCPSHTLRKTVGIFQ